VKEEKIKVRRITSFKKGEKIFSSTGVSKLKITVDGVVEIIEIPICSTGITEIIESFSKNAPQPPVANIKVEPGTDMARDFGLTKKNWVKIPDYSDANYIKEKEKYDAKLGMTIMATGIAAEFLDEAGNKITDPDSISEILKSQGLSAEHFGQLVTDITNLTKWTEEERENFLG